MTRVFVQRGVGPANSSQSRPPSGPPSNTTSASPSAPASSSTTPPHNTQASAVPVLSPSSLLLSPSPSSVSENELPEIAANEAQILNGEPQTLVSDSSAKALPSSSLSDGRAGNEIASSAVIRGQGFDILEPGREDAADRRDADLASQLQHVFVSEKQLDVTEVYGPSQLRTGDDAGRVENVVALNGEGQVEVSDMKRKDRSSEELLRSAASDSGSRKQCGRNPPALSSQGHQAPGQNSTPPPSLLSSVSSSSVPFSVLSSSLQSTAHAAQSRPLPNHLPPSSFNDTASVPRTHEESDPARVTMSAPNASEPVGCSYSAAPVPPAPPASFRRGSWVGSSASTAKRGLTSRRIPRAAKGTRNSPNSSRPTSPRAYGEGDGYNSADEQGSWTPGPSGYEDAVERERQFEVELRRVKGLEVRHMSEDGNCLFRAVADRVYGDAEMYDDTRQMCIDYMEKERDHFSQFVTESFTAYCKRKRRDKVYGNNLEIQAMAEMYNRPIHIYSYSTEPINIFHGSYETDLPPIRLSYHRGNHYNSLVDPCNPAVGAGLGFGSLRGRNIDTEQVKAALNAQQEQQIDKALLAEGRFYSDMELTEQEIERMVMEASRAEFLAGENRRIHIPWHEETSTSAGAEPSSSGTTGSPKNTSDVLDPVQAPNRQPATRPATSSPSEGHALSNSVRMLLSMGFSYLRVMEVHSIFGDNMNNMLCYLLETEAHSSGDGENGSRRKGKAAE